LEGAEDLGSGAYPAQRRMLRLQLVFRDTLSSVDGILRLLRAFLGKKNAYFEIKEVGLGARDAAVKELLIDEHKLYCLTFA
jgi:hypothetical protein